jgi:hypothetical protein
MLALVRDEEDHCFDQFPKETQSMKKDDGRENETDSVKKLIKVRVPQFAQFQNAMDSAKNMMKTENKCYTNFRDEVGSMKMAMNRTTSMPVKPGGSGATPKCQGSDSQGSDSKQHQTQA